MLGGWTIPGGRAIPGGNPGRGPIPGLIGNTGLGGMPPVDCGYSDITHTCIRHSIACISGVCVCVHQWSVCVCVCVCVHPWSVCACASMECACVCINGVCVRVHQWSVCVCMCHTGIISGGLINP